MSFELDAEVQAEVGGVPLGVAVTARVGWKLTHIEFVNGGNDKMIVTISQYVRHDDGSRSYTGAKRAIEFGTAQTAADPPADIVDPLTNEVLVAAGAVSAAIPSLPSLLAESLPQPITLTTMAQVFAVPRALLYARLQTLLPDLADAEVV